MGLNPRMLEQLAKMALKSGKLGANAKKAVEFGLSPEGRLALSAGKQGINYLKAQGRGPQANMPSNYTLANKGMRLMKKGGGFPDLTGDGKVTFADVLKGRGVGEKKAMGGMKTPKYMGGGKMEYDMGGEMEYGDGGEMYMHGGEVGSEGNPVPVNGRVQKDEQGRDFVMFQDSEGGEGYPVYSDNYGWNEVEGSMDGGAQVIRMDVNYPIMRNESGGYSLDASAYESMISSGQQETIPSEAIGRAGASAMGAGLGAMLGRKAKPDVNALLQMLGSQGARGQQ